MKLSGFGDRGVSLIEVLVAMLILGVGVMGYAAVQLNAVKVTEHSNSRSQAMAIAQDAIERLRANVTNVDDYLGGDAWSNVAAWKNCASDNPCGEEGMAEVDITQLNSMATSMLPSGSMLIERCSFLTQNEEGEDVSADSLAICVTVAWAGTVPSNCDQSSIESGDVGSNAKCVVVEFIP